MNVFRFFTSVELVTLANSEAISPEPIETKFREALPFIRNCMLVGKGRTYLALLLTIKVKLARNPSQRRQSGLKSVGSWIRVKKNQFLGKFPKTFDFSREIFIFFQANLRNISMFFR